MSNVIDLHTASKPSNDIMDVACDWIAKIDRGLTEQETKLYQTWLFKDPAHMNAMMEVAEFWDCMDELKRLSQVVPENLVTKEKSNKWPMAIAASLLIFCSTFFFQLGEGSAPQYVEIQKSYSTQVGEKNTIHLPDSSVLVLNTDSLVDITYTENARVIELIQGELHIDVAHNKDRPLSVVAGDKVIQAVGTAFNVEYNKKAVELIVTDGKVLVANVEEDLKAEEIKKLSELSLAVIKGQKVDLEKGKAKSMPVIEVVQETDISNTLSWQKGRLVFRGDSLEEAMAEIARYTEMEFELENNQALKDIQIAGMFKTGDIEGLLAVLESTFNVRHEKLNERRIKLLLKDQES